jgi:thiol-disulfide isomerase/thioredoxin
LIKQNGEKVQTFIIQVLFHQIYPYMIFERVYDKDFISEVEQKVRDLNFNSLSWEQLLAMCNILHLRQEKKYGEMLDLWGKIVPNLPNETLKIKYDVTLGRLQDMSEAEKKQAIAYLEGRMKGMGQSLLAKYRHIVTELSDYQGILFETDGLQKALAKARKENKAVFVDCYTSWCGPCKMMSSKVFPDKQAGDFFNPRFISLKIDMEKGEGKELAQKWNISAFPTYLILNPQGEVVYTSRGYIPVEELIKRMNEGLEQWKNNIKTGK